MGVENESFGNDSEHVEGRKTSLRIDVEHLVPYNIPNEELFVFKILIPGGVAGYLIGKKGSAITDIQASTQTRIKLSQNHEFYPGTSDRIAAVSGAFYAVRTAVLELFKRTYECIKFPKCDKIAKIKQNRIVFRGILPMAAGGLIIGHGGETVKSLSIQSKVRVQLTNKAQCPVSSERMFTIMGSVQSVSEVIGLILDKLSAEPILNKYSNPSPKYIFKMDISESTKLPDSPSTLSCHQVSSQPGQLFTYPLTTGEVCQYGDLFEMGMAVPDNLVGAMFGKDGRAIVNIQSLTGVKVKVSQRGMYIPGTTHRMVCIIGSIEGVLFAQFLINQRLHAAAFGIILKPSVHTPVPYYGANFVASSLGNIPMY